MDDSESEINIQRLLLLKRVFEVLLENDVDNGVVKHRLWQGADEDGSGELDIDEFVEKVGPHLGEDLSRTQLTQLFMKIDADAGGTVDWDEFTSFMFLQRTDVAERNGDDWRFFPADFRDRNDPICHHRAEITHILDIGQNDKIFTTGQDGTLRIWNSSDLAHIKTMSVCSNGWAKASVYLPRSHTLAIASTDGTLSFCGIVRGSYDFIGWISTSIQLGIPQCLCCLETDEEEYVICGDDDGRVALLLAEPDIASQAQQPHAFEILHRHRDWVTHIQHVPEIGLVSSSLDATIRIYDVSRGRLAQTYGHHDRGVHTFDWCPAYSLFASAGVERVISLWQPGTNARIVGELIGHSSSVTHLSIDHKTNHVMSLSLDRTIKVWDLRNHKCLQTIEPNDWPKNLDAHATCMTYDRKHGRLLTGSNRIAVWPRQRTSQEKSCHKFPIKATIYNMTFHVAVSADEEGTVCVWNVDNGSRESKFCATHGEQAQLSTACFDSNQRRLLTAANNHALRMWNFNSGKLLREYVHGIDGLEITSAKFIPQLKDDCDHIAAAGWKSSVFIWNDDDDDQVVEHDTLFGHREDVLDIAVCPEKDLMATGDYEGVIIVWEISSRLKRMECAHEAVHYEKSVDRLAWLQTTCMANQTPLLLLLSAGGDGRIRVWNITERPELLATLNGAHGSLEQISALACAHNYVILGDTAGNLKTIDVSHGIDLNSAESVKASFLDVAHWQGHEGPVTGIDFIPLNDASWLLMTCGDDTHVRLWTLDGGYVGQFGLDSWSLTDTETWRDPEGKNTSPPKSDQNEAAIRTTNRQDEESPHSNVQQMIRLVQSRGHRRRISRLSGAMNMQLETHPLQKLPLEIDKVISATRRS